jgi:hypothetical protein
VYLLGNCFDASKTFRHTGKRGINEAILYKKTVIRASVFETHVEGANYKRQAGVQTRGSNGIDASGGKNRQTPGLPRNTLGFPP